MTHETYLSIFGDHEDRLVYPYLSPENVWFIYSRTYLFFSTTCVYKLENYVCFKKENEFEKFI